MGIRTKFSNGEFYLNSCLLKNYSELVREKYISEIDENVPEIVDLDTPVSYPEFEITDSSQDKYELCQHGIGTHLMAVNGELLDTNYKNLYDQDEILDLSTCTLEDMFNVMYALISYHIWPKKYIGSRLSMPYGYSWCDLEFFKENIHFKEVIAMLGLFKILKINGYKTENEYTYSIQHCVLIYLESIGRKLINEKSAVEIWIYLKENKDLPGVKYFNKILRNQLYNKLMDIYLAPYFVQIGEDANLIKINHNLTQQSLEENFVPELPKEYRKELLEKMHEFYQYIMMSTY